MLDPDTVAKLKAKVEVYESELVEVTRQLCATPKNQTATEQGVVAAMMVRYIDIEQKLIRAYQDYTRELEKLVPR